MIVKLKNDTSGTTALEYGMIGAGIAAVVVLGVATLGDSLSTTFSDIFKLEVSSPEPPEPQKKDPPKKNKKKNNKNNKKSSGY